MKDLQQFIEAVKESKKELNQWMRWCNKDYSDLDANLFIKRATSNSDSNKEMHFVIRSGNRFIGMCALNNIDSSNECANLAYWIRTSECKKGFATKAVEMLIKYAFQQLQGINRIEIVCSTENVGSQKVANKVGAQREGILREKIKLGNKFHDAVVYYLLRSDMAI